MPFDELYRLCSARCTVTRLSIEVGTTLELALQVSGPEVSAVVTLSGVVDLELSQAPSNWSLDNLEFSDISDHQLEGLAVRVGAGQDGFMSCACASLEVDVSD